MVGHGFPGLDNYGVIHDGGYPQVAKDFLMDNNIDVQGRTLPPRQFYNCAVQELEKV